MELVVPMGALAHAAAALEQSTGGRVLEVRLANPAVHRHSRLRLHNTTPWCTCASSIAKPLCGTNAVLAYFVETMRGSTRHEFAIDATTDAFIANPEELYEPHTPVDLARRIAPP